MTADNDNHNVKDMNPDKPELGGGGIVVGAIEGAIEGPTDGATEGAIDGADD